MHKNQLDLNICNSESLTCNILKFIRSSKNRVFLCINPHEIQLLIRLKLGLHHLSEHKFKDNFQDNLYRISNCSEDIESSCHYLLQYPLYTNEILAFLNDIQGINNSILELSDSDNVEALLHGRKFLDIQCNTNVLNAITDFLLQTKTFDGRLF